MASCLEGENSDISNHINVHRDWYIEYHNHTTSDIGKTFIHSYTNQSLLWALDRSLEDSPEMLLSVRNHEEIQVPYN